MTRIIFLCLITCLTSSANAGQHFQVRTRVDVVVVPASVQDSAGKLVAGLVREDFRVFEDGQPQSISNFSVDPQPLSAAIVIDTGMSGIALRRLAPLFISVTGGFSEFDEMCSLRYDHLVHRLSDFTKDPVQIEKSLDVVKTIAEKQPAQVPGGDAAPTAPKIVQLLLQLIGGGGGISPGGPPPDPSKPPTTQRKTGPGSVRTSRVLFDAVFEAAKVLEGRPAHHRKIIFIISDGQVAGTNTHNLGDTTALLLRQEIQVYAVTTDLGAFEGRFGVLGTYAELTGGDVYRGLTTASMERAFSRITEQARNQYVLGYRSSNETRSAVPVFRKIEVKVANPNWKITHRKGYYQ